MVCILLIRRPEDVQQQVQRVACDGKAQEKVALANGTYLHVNALTAAGGAVISPNPGAVLMRVVINTTGATSNQLTIYDGQSISGKVIAVVNTTNTAIPALEYSLVAPGGLWYTLLAGTAADLTVVYQ